MMLRSMMMIAAAGAGTAASASPAHPRPIGQETTISFASNGGLRNWQVGSPEGDVVYVQDRRLAWYRVQLTGPCARDRTDLTMIYTTNGVGAFDRFSFVSLPLAAPGARCGVVSIRTSLPPPGRTGADKARH